MKKLTLIITFATLFCSAQNPYATKISIIKISPDTVCNGDSIKVYFTYTIAAEASPGQAPQTGIQIYDQGGVNNGYVFQGNENSLSMYPVQIISGASCRVIRYKIPSNYYTDQQNALGVLHIGTFKVYGRNGGQNLTSINKDCNFVYTVPTNTDVATGIQQISISNDDTPTYYDLSGNIVEKQYNQLMIEKVGNRRRKVFIQN